MQEVVEVPLIEIIATRKAWEAVVLEAVGDMEKQAAIEQAITQPPQTEVQAVGEVTRLVGTPGVETVLAV